MSALKQFFDSLPSSFRGRVTGFSGEYVDIMPYTTTLTKSSIRKDQFSELPKIGDTIEVDDCWKTGIVRIVNP